jgi:restriction system protein
VARSRSKSLENAFVQLIVLVLAGCVFLPPVRAASLWIGLASLAVLLIAGLWYLTIRLKHLDSIREQLSSTQSAPGRIGGPVQDDNPNLNALDWYQFEKLVSAVYELQGYSVRRMGGGNPDGGLDLTISKDGINFGVQCKHWKIWKVGVKQIRELLGALVDRGLSNGIFITLQQYTTEADEFATRHGIKLIGESQFMRMLESVNWQSNLVVQAILNNRRKFCPKCESQMVLRTATKGRNIGQEFWGCSTYPRCKGIIAA